MGYGGSITITIREGTTTDLEKHEFAAGSMGPKVKAACLFAHETGKVAALARWTIIGKRYQ